LQRDYHNVEVAKNSIKKNEIWALLRINWNYTESLKDRVTTGRDSLKDVVDYSFLDFWIDDSGNHIFEEITKKF
jgi:hypothetical protein